MTVCGNCFGACDCCGRLCRAARLSLEIVFALGIVSGDCSSRLFGVWRLFAEIVSAREIVLGDCFGPRDCLGDCFREGDCLWRLFGSCLAVGDCLRRLRRRINKLLRGIVSAAKLF